MTIRSPQTDEAKLFNNITSIFLFNVDEKLKIQ